MPRKTGSVSGAMRAEQKRLQQIAAALERAFVRQQRDLPWRGRYDPYEVWVSEVMLQQTRMEVVVPYFVRFVERFPSVSALAAADEAEVLAAWSGLGYYRRARMIHQGARHVAAKLGGVLPRELDALRSIPGVGRYTAGAILSIGFDERAAIADGNVQRVVARLEGSPHRARSAALESQAWEVAERLVAHASSPRMLNQALMEHGALVCTPGRPDCGSCVVATWCASREAAEDVPLPALMKPRVRLTVPLFVVRNEAGEVLLEQHHGRLMSAMYHLPHGSAELIADSSSRFRRVRRVGSFAHAITHRDVTFELYEADGELPGDEAVWVRPGAPLDLPHPSYVTKALRLVARSEALSFVPDSGLAP